jgi:hypothetical protein
MTTYSGTNLIGSSPGIYVGSSAVDKLYAGTNLVWQRADTTAPTQPPSFTASASGTSVSLAWGAATDNVAVTGYRVYRGASLLTTTTGRVYTDSGLSYSTSYSYSVSAIDAAGNESTKATASATTGAAPPPPVTYPFTVTTMSWNDRPFNGGPDVNGSWTQPGTYTLGSVYLNPANRYQISGYFYADSGAPYNNGTNQFYNDGYVTGSFSSSTGISTPSGNAYTTGSSYNKTSGTFYGNGTTTFYINISDSWYCGPGGNPMLTITCVG